MRVVDDAVLATLSGINVPVYDGVAEVDSNEAPVRVVTYDVPYAVYRSSIGDDGNSRLDGRWARRTVSFNLTYVGLDRRQAKWAGERIRDALQGKRLTVSGHKTWLCELLESQRIRPDHDAVRPDGSPLFYGVDTYALAVTLTPSA